ncbi:MAG: PorT family protein [Thermoanaerobaculia bacterium]|nr:PorT family protein [Thermoanaerobaculia bacterium]
MLFRKLFTIGFFLLVPFLLTAQIEDADLIFRELRVLEGTWFMPQDRGDRLEIWKVQDDSTLTGRGLRIKAENGDTVLLETMQLELRGDVIMYYATVRGQNKNEPVGFELTLADADGYLFENPAHDNPQKIRYLLLGNRELQVTTEGKRGNRTVTDEYVFEREFTPAGLEFRVRGGVNYFSLRGTGYLTASPAPEFTWKPGWELGTQFAFRGSGGFITINVEAGLIGKFSHANSAFTVPLDTAPFYLDYIRDVTYRQTWLVLAAIPEITLKRDGRLSLLAGLYYGRLLFNQTTGTELPGGDNKLFDANNDFKKNDIGILAGFQYKLNFGKKDLGGKLGLRANLGLTNIDNLYAARQSDGTNNSLYNGRVSMLGVSLYYSMNLLNL